MPTVFVVTFIFKLVSKESVYCVEEQTSSYRRSVWYLFFRGCRYHFLLLDVGDITINMCSASLFLYLKVFPNDYFQFPFVHSKPAFLLVPQTHHPFSWNLWSSFLLCSRALPTFQIEVLSPLSVWTDVPHATDLPYCMISRAGVWLFC